MLLRADLVSFTHPPLNVLIEIRFGMHTEVVTAEVRSALLNLEESGIVVDARERDRAQQMRFARIASAESDSNLKHDSGLLRNHRHRPAPAHHLCELVEQFKDVRLTSSEEFFNRELSA